MENGEEILLEWIHSINFSLAKLMYRLIKPLGLSPAQGRLMMELKNRGGSATVGELASGMETPYSNASNVCNRLLAMGLIEKSREQSDMRSVRVTFSGKGQQVLDRLKEYYDDMTADIRSYYDKDELTRISAALQQLDEGLKKTLAKNALPL